MSKFLKFIVHFVVICTIVCAAGLILPPFFGVTTEIMTDSKEDTNLPIGSVTYAIPVKATDIYVGDPILVHEDSKIYRYSVQALDLENGTGTVIDPSVTNGETITVAIKEYVPKVVFTLSGVGYLYVATQSTEGKIILGLAVLFLIILYIIAELWEKDPKEEVEENVNSSSAYVKSKKELKREEKERARMMKEEEREIRSENKGKKKKKKAEKRMIRTGGFVDEIEEEDDEYTEEPARPVSMQSAASEAHEVLKKEIAAATSEEPDPTAELREMLGEMTKEEPAQKEEQQKEGAEEENRDSDIPVRKMAIPQWSVSQLVNRAKSAGDSPEIIKDDITEVTLFDYSDIVGEDGEEE